MSLFLILSKKCTIFALIKAYAAVDDKHKGHGRNLLAALAWPGGNAADALTDRAWPTIGTGLVTS